MKVKVEIIILLLLIPLAVILGLVITRPAAAPAPPVALAPSSQSLPPSAAPEVSIQPSLASDSAAPQPSVASAQTASVSLNIEGPTKTSFSISIAGQPSVADVMQKAQQDKLVQMKTKDYGGALGLFMESLNGIANNNDTRLYWTLYVNDKLSVEGMSQAKVKPGDTVTWKYENINNSL